MIHDRFDDLKEDDVKRILSKYGAGQAVEFRAEMIAGILAGKSFPKEFLDAAYLDRYLSDERGKLIYDMGSGEVPNTSMLEKQFGSMMEALFHEDGAALRIELLEHPEVTKFIDSHAQVMDNAFRQVEMSDGMRSRLQESDWIFSGMKTFHELNEAFPSLLDENGERKTFERFLNDVQSIDRTYNQNYLRAEYNYAEASAEMAAKWEAYEEDGDDYYLQYRTAGDDKVRPEHAALNGITLPMSDPFWDEYYPPNGWNCRCTVVQVLKDKYPATDRSEAYRRGREALVKDTKGMFRFNSGKQGKTFPDYNPYTLSKCNNCSKKLNLAKSIPETDLCGECLLVRKQCAEQSEFKPDDKMGQRLLISKSADPKELDENIRIARELLAAFPDETMTIRKHVLIPNVSNPEYTIGNLLADRKTPEGPNGITNGFSKGVNGQHCQALVFDLESKMGSHPLPIEKIVNKLVGRKTDFVGGGFERCYMTYHGVFVCITKDDFMYGSKQELKAHLRELLTDAWA